MNSIGVVSSTKQVVSGVRNQLCIRTKEHGDLAIFVDASMNSAAEVVLKSAVWLEGKGKTCPSEDELEEELSTDGEPEPANLETERTLHLADLHRRWMGRAEAFERERSNSLPPSYETKDVYKACARKGGRQEPGHMRQLLRVCGDGRGRHQQVCLYGGLPKAPRPRMDGVISIKYVHELEAGAARLLQQGEPRNSGCAAARLLLQ